MAKIYTLPKQLNRSSLRRVHIRKTVEEAKVVRTKSTTNALYVDAIARACKYDQSLFQKWFAQAQE